MLTEVIFIPAVQIGTSNWTSKMGEPRWGSSGNSLSLQSSGYNMGTSARSCKSLVVNTGGIVRFNTPKRYPQISSTQRTCLLTTKKEKEIRFAFSVVVSLTCTPFKAHEISRLRSGSCQRRKRDRRILSVQNVQIQHFVMYLFRVVGVYTA